MKKMWKAVAVAEVGVDRRNDQWGKTISTRGIMYYILDQRNASISQYM